MKDPHTQAAEFLEKQLETQAPNLDLDMRRALASLGAKLAERKTEEIKAQQSRPQTAKILQFPLPFGEDTRAVSNPLARCALFAPVKERQHFRDYVTVGEVDGVKIEIKGEQLNQDDQDALIQFFTMANHRAIGETIFCNYLPSNTSLRVSKGLMAFSLLVSQTERRIQNVSEPPTARKPPITFSLTLAGRTARSAKLLSKGTRQSVRNCQT